MRSSTSFSDDGPARLHDVLEAHVGPGHRPGLVALAARGGDVHVEVIGAPTFGDPTPLARDAIFRLASLSKPLAAAAALSLVEEGALRLDAPIDDLLPELANRRVLRTLASELDDTVPARRAITVEDVLSYRMGYGSLTAPAGTLPVQRAEAELGLHSIGGPPWPPVAHDPDSWIAALGSLPLFAQPGEHWLYNTSGQVLGVLIERAAGKPLAVVMRERIFDPLGMRDTGFSVPAEKRARLTGYYSSSGGGDELTLIDGPEDSWWAAPPRFPDASGWLVSTIDDYWAFVSMLLARGEHEGERVLAERTVALMTKDRLTPAQRASAAEFLGEAGGWGLGLAAPAAGAVDVPLPQQVGWDGGSGTTWRSNFETGVTGILLTQRQRTSPASVAVFDDFWRGVEQL